MSIKEELSKKVPEHHRKTTEYNIFLKEIAQKDLNSVKAVKMYIDTEIKNCEDTFKKTTFSNETKYTKRRRERLKFLKLIKQKVLNYV